MGAGKTLRAFLCARRIVVIRVALSKERRKKSEAMIEAVAFQGTGVLETLKEIAKQVLTELKAGG
jgi:hypothetical protein